jgi:hypothetical protein
VKFNHPPSTATKKAMLCVVDLKNDADKAINKT